MVETIGNASLTNSVLYLDGVTVSFDGYKALRKILTEGLTKRFGRTEALVDLDLEVEVGEVFGYLGPNGAGKSTLLRLITGTLRARAGLHTGEVRVAISWTFSPTFRVPFLTRTRVTTPT